MTLASMLVEYNIVGLSLATIVGIMITLFFRSFVDDMVMPVFSGVVKRPWEEYSFTIGNATFNVGKFISTLLYVFLVMILVLLALRYLISPMLKDYESNKQRQLSAQKEIQAEAEKIRKEMEKIKRQRHPLL